MKKVILSLFALAAMGLSANAQQVVKFGPKAGVNIANLNGSEADTDMKIGFHVGAFAEIFFTDKFALQPEVVFSQQGAKASGEFPYSGTFNGVQVDILLDGEQSTTLSYINIPVMAKYYVIDNLAIEAGPYVGFLMKSEMEIEGDYTVQGQTMSFNETFDIKETMNSVDYGLGLGASYSMDNGFFGGARYNLGLSDIFKDDAGEDGIKNGVIQISVGYKF
ncbi:porin family protein [Avrilella dinanensis]|uniref:Outer membrane protein beta-barrel domain-containing protein n=1 Tax=Avrilella dinanensis TaxID=2008672 RepID=A0A2M9R7W4_9FLAO|nr:porin family protein [Avrilella dinanensis]PJR04959.1 hypothetical protein CDL10_10705 [Avrilella dinanensis]